MTALALIAALLAPPIDCEEAVRAALDRVLDSATAEAGARAQLATATDPRSRPGLQARVRGGHPTDGVVDRAGLRLTLPPPGTDAAYGRIGQATVSVVAARLGNDALVVAAEARRAHLAVRRAEAELADAQALAAIEAARAELRARQAQVGMVPGLRAVQARLAVEAAQDEIAARQSAIAAARAVLSRYTGTDSARGICAARVPAPKEHPAIAASRAESQLVAAQVEARDLGADLWPDFIEAAWDDQGKTSRGLISVGVDIPLSTSSRADLVQVQARAQRARVDKMIEDQVAAAKARLLAAEGHLQALTRPVPADFAAAAKHPTAEGLAIREALIRSAARRRAAELAVEAARIELLAAQGTVTLDDLSKTGPADVRPPGRSRR